MVKNLSEVKKVVKEYKRELKRHNISISKIILYGSFAHGNPKPYSDIDLIVVSPDLVRFSLLKRQEILSQLAMNIEAPLEVIGYTPKELENSDHTIFGQVIKRTGKVLHV